MEAGSRPETRDLVKQIASEIGITKQNIGFYVSIQGIHDGYVECGQNNFREWTQNQLTTLAIDYNLTVPTGESN